MRCRITDEPNIKVYWSVPGVSSYIGPNNVISTDTPSRFSVQGQETGEYNLVISQVQQEDNGPYICVVILNSDQADTRVMLYSETATLTVIEVPDTGDTVCWSTGGRVTLVGDPVSLRCASSDPAVGLTWFLGDLNLGHSSLNISPQGTGIETEFPAQSQANLQTYTCQPDNGQYSPCSVTLEVKHPPLVIIEDDGVIETGLDARFACRATGNPDNFAYTWHYNGYQVRFEEHSRFNRARLEKSGSVLVLPDLTDIDNNVTLRCEAVNALGATVASHEINARVGKTLAQIIGPILLGIIIGLVLIVLVLYAIWWRRQRIKVQQISKKKSKSVERNNSRRDEVPTVDTGIVYRQTLGGFGSRYGKKSTSNGDLARSGLDLESVGYGPDVTQIPAYRATAEEEREDDGALRPIPRKKSTGSMSSTAIGSKATVADDTALISPNEEPSFTYHVNPHFEDHRYPGNESQPANDLGPDEIKEHPSSYNIEIPESNLHDDEDNIMRTEL